MKKRALRPAVVTVAALGVTLLAASPACADPPPRPAACPAQPPALGTACARPTLACGYRACGDYWTLTAVCSPVTHRWEGTESTCNPPVPRPTANPPAPPQPPPPPARPRRPRRPVIHRNPPGHPPPPGAPEL